MILLKVKLTCAFSLCLCRVIIIIIMKKILKNKLRMGCIIVKMYLEADSIYFQ